LKKLRPASKAVKLRRSAGCFSRMPTVLLESSSIVSIQFFSVFRE
jgi:hypothetical protein